MSHVDTAKAKGHLLLAKMGEKVLRPGGKEFTQNLIADLKISSEDKIVEFPPGLGYTASFILARKPKNVSWVCASFLKNMNNTLALLALLPKKFKILPCTTQNLHKSLNFNILKRKTKVYKN